jgi:hypothetical protein
MDFWAKRSALAGVPIEDRIREHFERLRYARRWYWRHAKTVIPGNVFWSNVLTAAPLKKQGFIVGPELDVRGILFVRRGTPTNVVKTGSGDDNESWYYANPDGTPDFFHFTKSEMAPDFEESDGVPGCDYQYLIDRAQFDSRIGHAVAICAGKMAKDENRLVFIRRQMRFEAQEAARREPILQPHQIIPFSYALYNVRSTEGLQPMLLAALRIPIDELQTKPAGSSFEYAARITISLVDSASGRHLQFDSVYHFITPKGLAANSALRGFAYLPAFTTPSAQYRIRVVDGNDSQRGWVRSGMIAVDPYLAQKQQLSDILLTGAGRSMAGWRRGNVILDVQPAAAVTTDFGIYFEVYNAKSTGLYKVTIRFQNLHRSLLKHTEEFRLSFDEELSAIPPDFWAVSKTLSVALPDGDYALQITLVSPDGSKASQIRNIRIVGSRLTP